MPVAVLAAVRIVVRNRIPVGRYDSLELIARPLRSWPHHPQERAQPAPTRFSSVVATQGHGISEFLQQLLRGGGCEPLLALSGCPAALAVDRAAFAWVAALPM